MVDESATMDGLEAPCATAGELRHMEEAGMRDMCAKVQDQLTRLKRITPLEYL